jgi:transcriptional regulator of met regulon
MEKKEPKRVFIKIESEDEIEQAADQMIRELGLDELVGEDDEDQPSPKADS